MDVLGYLALCDPNQNSDVQKQCIDALQTCNYFMNPIPPPDIDKPKF